MNTLQRERHGPWVIALICTSISLFIYWKYAFCLSNFLADKESEFLSVDVSLGAIWAGFIGVIMGLFMTIPQGPILTLLRNSGYINEMHDYLVSSVKSSILFSGVSLIGFFFIKSEFPWFFCFWTFFAVHAILTFMRISSIMYKVMKYIHNQP